MHVRALRPEDWEAFREIRLRALADAPGAFASTFAGDAAFPEAVWRERTAGTFVIEDPPDGWLGMAGGFVPEGLPDRVVVWGMWVAPEARGRGAGLMLLDAVAGWARARGAAFLQLSATDQAPEALRLYLAAGFTAVARRPLPEDPARMETILERRL